MSMDHRPKVRLRPRAEAPPVRLKNLERPYIRLRTRAGIIRGKLARLGLNPDDISRLVGMGISQDEIDWLVKSGVNLPDFAQFCQEQDAKEERTGEAEF